MDINEVNMLWLDSDPKRPILAKLRRATEYFAKKHGLVPVVSRVHPKTFEEFCVEMGQPGAEYLEVDGVRVTAWRYLLRYDYLITAFKNGNGDGR